MRCIGQLRPMPIGGANGGSPQGLWVEPVYVDIKGATVGGLAIAHLKGDPEVPNIAAAWVEMQHIVAVYTHP